MLLAVGRWSRSRWPMLICAAAMVLWSVVQAPPAHAQTRLSNAAYASAGPLFKQIDAAFAAEQKKQTGRDVRVETKTGPDGEQVRALQNGSGADVVMLGDAASIDALATADLVLADWRTRYPNRAAPWGSTVVFLVHSGNPKRIKDWADLARGEVRVSMPDPALDATGRLIWLSAWGALRKDGRTEAQTAQFAAGLLKRAAPLAPSFDAAAQAFRAPDSADVLVALTSELTALQQRLGDRAFEAIRPRRSLFVGHPVAVVERTTHKKGTGELAKAYLSFLFTPAVQAMATAQGLQAMVSSPLTSPSGTARGGDAQPGAGSTGRLFTIDDAFGSPHAAERAHFGTDGWLQRLRAKAAAH